MLFVAGELHAFVAAGHWTVLVDAPAALKPRMLHKGVSPTEHVESAGRYVDDQAHQFQRLAQDY